MNNKKMKNNKFHDERKDEKMQKKEKLKCRDAILDAFESHAFCNPVQRDYFHFFVFGFCSFLFFIYLLLL